MSTTFFTDRDLGKQFPALLRTAGISVESHVDHFPDDAKDEDWIVEVGKRGWDQRPFIAKIYLPSASELKRKPKAKGKLELWVGSRAD